MGALPTGVMAALITLIGVIVGALIASISVYFQLRHDAKEREKERQMALRRDVYLFAAKEIGKRINYLFNFYSITEPYSDECEAAINQVCTIGGDDTVRAALNLSYHIAQAFSEVIPDKFEINVSVKAREGLQETHQKQSKEIDRWLEEMKQYNLQGQVDSQKWAYIKGAFNFANGERDTTFRELTTSMSRHLGLVSALAQKCLERTQEAERLLTPLLVAVRKELNCPVDEAAFRQIQRVNQTQWKRNVEAYISVMKAKQENLLNRLSPQEPPSETASAGGSNL